MNSFLEAVKGLGEKERDALVEHIMSMLAEPNASQKNKCRDLIAEANLERPNCPHCAAKASLGYIIKRGLNKGAQRYYCKSCGKYFVATTNTAFAWSRKDADTWRKFIRLTIAGKSLIVCKEECGIAYQTAFNWRHKILSVFTVNQEGSRMSANAEVDETMEKFGRPPLDLAGQKFGSLTPIRPAGRRGGKIYWKCRCDCGKTTYVRASNLTGAAVMSCGCRRKGHSGRKRK